MRVRAAALLMLMSLGVPACWAKAPVLYSRAGYQSPVQAQPDDLLLLPGERLSADDTVVYVAHEAGANLEPPAALPTQSTANSGIAPIASSAGTPHALTVLLPNAATPGRTYALWARNRAGEWSNAVLINDPRPLWITPGIAYSTRKIAGLPRQIKIVGRNMSYDNRSLRVRLTGPSTVELRTVPAPDQARTLNEYVATAELPARLPPGEYSVQIGDAAARWRSLPQAILQVRPDPSPRREFSPAQPEHGSCRPDDSRDDTECLVRTITAADSARGGIVQVTEGQWDLYQNRSIVIPTNVEIAGLGRATIVRHSHDARRPIPAFVLLGSNRVSGLTLREATPYRAGDKPSAMLQLGPDWSSHSSPAAEVADIIITDNVFDRPGYAISDGGLPLTRVFITHNRIGAYHTGVELGGSRFNVAQRFGLSDSVIAHNTFVPGSYLDVPAGQGAMAAEIGASRRLDFSSNIADGTAVDALDDAAAPGWRAAFFWHMNDNHEMMLVSLNQATCTGDKAGDGEAIAYDNNANTYPFSGAVVVTDASPNSVTVRGAPKNKQNGRTLNTAEFYRGHWLHILQGPGIGQARRIESYEVAADERSVTFRISPEWDVVPRREDSRATIGRQMWQVYTVDNVIDHRAPLCRKSNRNRPRGGAIALWSEMTDAVVSGNQQYDTDGIVIHQGYRPDAPGCTNCNGWVNAKSFIEVRDNLIDGEYDWSSDCSWSGIQAQYAAAPEVAPATVSFGISISHNEIKKADGWRGGAISLPLTWHAGPPPHRWMLIDNTLIHHNRIRDLAGPAARKRCDTAGSWERVGLKLAGSDLVWRTVTYKNSCTATSVGYRRGGYETVNRCEQRDSHSCECPQR